MLIPGYPSRVHILLFCTTSLLILLFLGYHFAAEINFLVITRVLSDIEPQCHSTLLGIIDTRTSADQTKKPIPNIVHYVWLIEDREDISLDFKTFISVYSASIYFKPDTIYIHTDATSEQFERAKSSNDESTRWTLSIPKVVHNHVTVPKHTSACRKIIKVQHRSDFVRTQQLYALGGIYVDTDVIALRDVKVLRESGFSNVVGLEEAGRVNNGFMMSKKGSALISIFRAEQHRVFDNRWTTHSVNLLSALSYRLQAVPGEVLVLGMKSFSPSSWTKKDINTLFAPHTNTVPSLPAGHKNIPNNSLLSVPKTFQDSIDWWDSNDWSGNEEWEIDYSSSYVIHAFDGRPQRYWPAHVSLEYVLKRQSNYARAVYPAVQHAIDAGVIDR